MKMRKTLIIAVVAVLIIVITGGYLAFIYLPSQNGNNGNQNNEQQTSLSTVEQIRGGALLYLAANHTETLPLMGEFSWSGGKQDTGGLGAETYVYTHGSWSVVIDYPVVPNPLYTITVDYSSHDVSANWMGTFQNQTFTETSSTINAPESYITQEQIRDLTMMYLRIYHNETSTYMHGMAWTGGRQDMGMMAGSDKYNYQGSGWNFTMQNPVVPNPTYTIKADYTPSNMHSAMMTWEGTLQNGTITQTSYKYNP
jgi:hypothetical protein